MQLQALYLLTFQLSDLGSEFPIHLAPKQLPFGISPLVTCASLFPLPGAPAI
jgi:hypothetical protein